MDQLSIIMSCVTHLGCPEPETPYVSLLTVFTYATFAMGATILAWTALRRYGLSLIHI